jgi:hypothetical protein
MQNFLHKLEFSSRGKPLFLSDKPSLEKFSYQHEFLTIFCYGISKFLLAAVILSFPPNALTAIPSLKFWGTRLKKVTQIYQNIERILDEFESKEIIITPELAVPENGTLDLFVRFPNLPKTNFAINFRSNGDSKVYYNREKEILTYRRRKGGGKYRLWQVDLFQRIGLQEFWLRKNRPDLFGQSSRDKNRAVTKVLVLTGETKLREHPEEMYTTVGDQHVLLIHKRVFVYLMEESQLISFIKAWLAKAESTINS